MERLYGRRLAHLGVAWVPTSTGLTWKLDLSNPTHRWIVYGKYEGAAFIDWARDHLPPDGVVVDSGANIGQMLLYLAGFVPRGRVLAFEPHPDARAWLMECLAKVPEFRVQCFPFALGTQPADLFLEAKGTPELHGAWSQVSNTAGQPIRVVRLQDMLAELGIGTVHLWKLDVEGYELAALEGAERLLQDRSIRAIYAELGFGNGPAIVAYLGKRGYRCGLFDRRGRLHPPSTLPDHANGLFLPEERIFDD